MILNIRMTKRRRILTRSQLGNNINEHVKDRYGGNSKLHDATVTLTSKVRDREGLGRTLTDHGSQKADNDSWKGAGKRVANHTQPRELRSCSHFRCTIQDPGTHSRSKETESNGPATCRVSRTQKVINVTRFWVLVEKTASRQDRVR